MRKLLLILKIAAVVLTGCTQVVEEDMKPSIKEEPTSDNKLTKTNLQSSSLPDTGFTLSFEDNFSDTSLDVSKWNYRTGGKLQGYNRAENVSLSTGKLNIALKQETYSGYDYTCGGVITKSTFKYGYYETRALLPSLPGWHNSFWLYGAVTGVNEIDGFEVDSHSPTSLYTNTHHYSPHVNHGAKLYSGVNTSTSYHVYGWEWTPSWVNFYVDSTLIRTVRYIEPHAYQNVWLTGLAYDVGYGIQGNTSVSFDYFRYYTKSYPAESFVDNGETGYSESGTGWINSGLTGWNTSSTRATNQLGSYVKWTPNIQSSGTYKLYIYKVIEVNSDPNAKITISHNGSTDIVYLNYSTGTSGWVDVGNYVFSSGTTDYITNTVNTTSKWCRADAIRLVKQ